MKTKEFAKLCGVEKRTLFYYDEIGLLKPDKVLENGYREYTQRQASRLEEIKLLQSTGLSLSEIKAMLANEEQGGNIKIIEECVSRVDERIRKLRDGKSYLEHRMELRDSYIKHIGKKFFVEHMAERKLSVIYPDYRPRIAISYQRTGYYLGIAEDANSLRPKFLFKHAIEGEQYIPFPEGDYLCTFIEEDHGIYVPPYIEEFIMNAQAMGYKVDDTVYVEDTPAWILDRHSGVVVRLSVKVKDEQDGK